LTVRQGPPAKKPPAARLGGLSRLPPVAVRADRALLLALFLVYYLLRDGRAFVAWLIEVAPISNVVCDRLFRRIGRTAWGVIVGHLLVDVAQGLVGGVGLFVGPVVLAVLAATVESFDEEYDALADGTNV
jgi:predicted PurR-regulated permease PerM